MRKIENRVSGSMNRIAAPDARGFYGIGEERRPLKVLMVNKFHYLKGGSETYHFAVGESLQSMGHEVAWFAMEDPANLPCKQSKYFVSASDYSGNTSALKKARDGMSLIYSNEAKRKFDALLREFQPDVIHLNLVHRQITFSILDAPYLQEHRVPVVYTAHDYIPICPNCTMLDGSGKVCDACLGGDYSQCVKRKCVKGSAAKSALAMLEAQYLRHRKMYSKIDAVIAPSEFMRSKLLEGGFPAEQVVTMQNFAKDNVIARARRDDSASRERSFLYFGRLSPEKGVATMVGAFLNVADRLPDGWRLEIVGDGPERDAIEEMTAASPAGSRIVITGLLGHEEVLEHAERAFLAIASSRWRENMPFSIVEAFACGTPVIGSRIGGIPELVGEGKTGFLCEPGDRASLEKAMLRAASMGGPEYAVMQENCRGYVIDRCDQGSYMNRLVGLYRSLIAQKEVA